MPAGWRSTFLAFGLIGISTSVPWFRRGNPASQPLLKDWTAARTLPFAAFMGSALLLSTFTVIPDLWYVVKVLAMSLCAGCFFARVWHASILADRYRLFSGPALQSDYFGLLSALRGVHSVGS